MFSLSLFWGVFVLYKLCMLLLLFRLNCVFFFFFFFIPQSVSRFLSLDCLFFDILSFPLLSCELKFTLAHTYDKKNGNSDVNNIIFNIVLATSHAHTHARTRSQAHAKIGNKNYSFGQNSLAQHHVILCVY